MFSIQTGKSVLPANCKCVCCFSAHLCFVFLLPKKQTNNNKKTIAVQKPELEFKSVICPKAISLDNEHAQGIAKGFSFLIRKSIQTH